MWWSCRIKLGKMCQLEFLNKDFKVLIACLQDLGKRVLISQWSVAALQQTTLPPTLAEELAIWEYFLLKMFTLFETGPSSSRVMHPNKSVPI